MVRLTRRMFIGTAGAAFGLGLMPGAGLAQQESGGVDHPVVLHGPGTRYVPRIRASFIRRRGDYGLRWPGAIYDGEAARKNYQEQLEAAGKTLGLQLEIRPEPLYSLEEGEQWVAQAEADPVDGLLLVLLDRQEHTWPVAGRAVDSPVPAVIFAPIGTAFTTNTAPLADKPGAVIYSSDDFGQALTGLKMLKAGARLREARFVVIKGDERKDVTVGHFGTRLRYIPARTFLEYYERMAVSPEMEMLADAYIKHAERIQGPGKEDVINGVKSYQVAQALLEQEEGDGISMDCLGALGKTKVSLPCIAWSRMLDMGIPAACEADIEACVTHALVQYLFDKPGFQQDPVPDTAARCLIGAHCTCPTRLRGFDAAPEPYFLSYHHGCRDAVPVPRWELGQRVTVADVLLTENTDAPPAMVISTGSVERNLSVPPSGGCVVSVSVKLDNETELLKYPGFHQVFFYGDHKEDLAAYCKLFRVAPRIV